MEDNFFIQENTVRDIVTFLNNPYSMEVVLVIFKITAVTSFPKKEVAAGILKITNTTSILYEKI